MLCKSCYECFLGGFVVVDFINDGSFCDNSVVDLIRENLVDFLFDFSFVIVVIIIIILCFFGYF